MTSKQPESMYLAITPFFHDPTQPDATRSDNFVTGFYRNSALELMYAPPGPKFYFTPPLTQMVSGSMKCIRPGGPPLPLTIECKEDNAAALTAIVEIAKELHEKHGGASSDTAPLFVKEFVTRIRSMTIWAHIPVFYGILASPTHRKLVTSNKQLVADAQSGNNTHTVFEFDSFIKAFIYILGGGNLKLRDMGLHEWVGKRAVTRGNGTDAPLPDPSFSKFLSSPPRPSSRPAPSTPDRASRAQSPTLAASRPATHLPTRANADAIATSSQGKAEKRQASTGSDDGEDDIEFVGFLHAEGRRNARPSVPRPQTNRLTPTPSGGITMSGLREVLPTISTNQKRQAPTPNAAHYPNQARRSGDRPGRGSGLGPAPHINIGEASDSAQLIIPTHILQDYRFSSEKVPFGVLRSTDNPQENEVIYLGDRRVGEINSPLPMSSALPPLVEIYLRGHGWNSVVIELIRQLHTEGASLADFLVDLGLAQVPIMEAYFIWMLKGQN